MAWLGRKLQIAIDVGRKSLVEALLLCVAIILESDAKKDRHILFIQRPSTALVSASLSIETSSVQPNNAVELRASTK